MTILRLTLTFLAGAVLLASPAGATQKPNVLFIVVDDLRDWVGFLAGPNQAKTPNMDRLARLGVSFPHAYCASPSCNPSRAAALSGLRPSTTGVYENDVDFRKYIPSELTLMHTFLAAGYSVLGSGKAYHDAFPRDSDWDDYLLADEKDPPLPPGQSDGVRGIKFAPLDCRDEDLSDWKVTDYGIAALAQKHDRPFFLSVGLRKPHMPWNVPRKYYDLFPLESIKLPPYLADDLADVPPAGQAMARYLGDHPAMVKSGRWKEAIQGYLAAIAYADMNLGRLLDAFEKSAYRNNTIIVFWSDHGWHLGEKDHWRKFTLWEEATRAPVVWVVPGLTKAGAICDRPIDLMSLYPTLTDLAGIATPKHVQGVSIRPLLADPQAAWTIPAVMTYRHKNHAVRTAEWRYIRYENGDEELYDERADPHEYVNLAARPDLAGVKAALAAHMPTSDAPTPPSDRGPKKAGTKPGD